MRTLFGFQISDCYALNLRAAKSGSLMQTPFSDQLNVAQRYSLGNIVAVLFYIKTIGSLMISAGIEITDFAKFYLILQMKFWNESLLPCPKPQHCKISSTQAFEIFFTGHAEDHKK